MAWYDKLVVLILSLILFVGVGFIASQKFREVMLQIVDSVDNQVCNLDGKTCK